MTAGSFITVTGIVQIINLILLVGFVALFVTLTVLAIRALLKYLR